MTLSAQLSSRVLSKCAGRHRVAWTTAGSNDQHDFNPALRSSTSPLVAQAFLVAHRSAVFHGRRMGFYLPMGVRQSRQRTRISPALHSTHAPATTPVYTALRTSDPTMQLSQMSETSVSRLALPGCIEVGEPGKSYLEASLQLGVWCFAGLAKHDELKMQSRIEAARRMHRQVPASMMHPHAASAVEEAHDTVDGDVLAADANTADLECNLPVFGWTAIGMDWRLHIAYRDPADDGVVVLGPLDSGGLGSVMAFFKLFQTATALAIWAKGTYWTEFRRIAEAR